MQFHDYQAEDGIASEKPWQPSDRRCTCLRHDFFYKDTHRIHSRQHGIKRIHRIHRTLTYTAYSRLNIKVLEDGQ